MASESPATGLEPKTAIFRCPQFSSSSATIRPMLRSSTATEDARGREADSAFTVVNTIGTSSPRIASTRSSSRLPTKIRPLTWFCRVIRMADWNSSARSSMYSVTKLSGTLSARSRIASARELRKGLDRPRMTTPITSLPCFRPRALVLPTKWQSWIICSTFSRVALFTSGR